MPDAGEYTNSVIGSKGVEVLGIRILTFRLRRAGESSGMEDEVLLLAGLRRGG